MTSPRDRAYDCDGAKIQSPKQSPAVYPPESPVSIRRHDEVIQ